jgi:hypothetical protein
MIFSTPEPEKAAALVAKIQARRAEALAELEKAKFEFSSASLEHAEGTSGADKKLQVARTFLCAAEAKVSEADAALEAANTKHATALAAVAESEKEQKWKEVEALLKRREKLAVEIEESARNLAKKHSELLDLGIEAVAMAPFKDSPLSSSPLSPLEVTSSLRKFLFKVGCSWAFRWPWGSADLPDFVDRVKDGNAWLLLSRRDAGEKTSH